jgi:hypothetical protein
MDAESQRNLARLIRSQSTASLGTLHGGAPLVSMVLYAVAPDFTAFFIHASRLAQHTQDMLQDARVGWMIAEADAGRQNPQTLGRVSILGEAAALSPTDTGCDAAKSIYLTRFPQAAATFAFKDFSLYRLAPRAARYVAGFGKVFDLGPDDLRQAAAVPSIGGATDQVPPQTV